MAESIISERKAKLEAYLNTILNGLNLVKYPLILDFIGVTKDELLLFENKNTALSQT